MTPQHLNRLALLPDEYLLPSNNTLTFDFVQGSGAHRRTRETHNMYDISILLRIALAKIPQIPFEYILDIFRWRLLVAKLTLGCQ
uniref:Uncharacterized protein n=1 Tax=Lutzomyia longipalpis TaxID=7200 RepID=A0A1B0CRV8_LUTLO